MSYTYNTLVIDIIDNMEEDSDEFYSAMPDIIRRAQNYLQNRVQVPEMLVFHSTNTIANNRELDLPADLHVLKSVLLQESNRWRPLIMQTNEFLAHYWPNYSQTGVPKYYANKDNTKLWLAPTPAAAYPVNLEYVVKPPVLSFVQQTNWFSENLPNAFFMAAMMFANAWAKNAEATAAWKQLVDDELLAISERSRRTRREDVAYRGSGTPENNLAEGQT